MTNNKTESTHKFFLMIMQLSPNGCFFVVALNILTVITESFGFAMLFPLLNLSNISNIENSNASQFSYSKIALPVSTELSLEVVVFVICLLLSSFAMLSYLRTLIIHRIESKISCNQQENLFRSISQAEWSEFLTHKKSDLIELLIRESYQVGSAFVQASNIISSLLTFTALSILACFISLSATSISIGLGFTLWIITRRYNQQAYAAGRAIYPAYQKMYANCEEHLEGLPIIKIFDVGSSHLKQFIKSCESVVSISYNYVRARARTAIIYRLFITIILGITAYISIRFSMLSISEFIVLAALFSRILPQILNIHQSYQSFLNTIPSFSTISNITEKFNLKKEIYSDNTEIEENPYLKEVIKGVSLKSVSFHYPLSSGNLALCNLNVDISPTGVTQICGTSGSGKTTLIRLLAGLIVPTSGHVKIGNIALDSSNLSDWRQIVSYVPQETVLPYSSVREALLIADKKADDNDLWKALELSGIADAIKKLPHQLDSDLGDRGCYFSGGERQRIAIARALLKKPKFLILDEATNNLDKNSENIIFSIIDDLKTKIAVIIVSHNDIPCSIIKQKIILENGKINAGEITIAQNVQLSATKAANLRSSL